MLARRMLFIWHSIVLIKNKGKGPFYPKKLVYYSKKRSFSTHYCFFSPIFINLYVSCFYYNSIIMNAMTFSTTTQQKRMSRKIWAEVILTVILATAAFLLTI